MFRRALQLFAKRRNDVESYWHQRFKADPDGWVAGGDRRLSDDLNYRSALEIMDIIAAALKRFAAPFEGKSLLDAGCGMGHFTEMTRKLGFSATGTDFSELAILRARKQYPQPRFEVADLADLRLSARFDAIITVNVLVAIAEQDGWRTALESIAGHLAPAGVLVIFETLRQPGEQADSAAHVAFRTLDEYRQLTLELGLQVLHHERVCLQTEGIRKDLVIINHRDTKGT